MFYSDDPVADFAAFDAAQAERDKDFPICEDCGYPIYDNDYNNYYGKIYCRECWEIYHRGTW